MTRPTERTLKYLRKQGCVVAVVERWNAFAKRRQDLFGVIDILALEPGQAGVVGVQTCSGSGGDHAERVAKIRASEAARLWVECQNGLIVVSWAVRGARGEPKRWTPRVTHITLADFAPEAS